MSNNDFRKKPVVIQAVQLRWDTWQEMCEHAGVGSLSDGKPEGFWPDGEGTGRIGMRIPTLESVMEATEGDWIIRGVKGELYPCKPDIFEATYERAALAAQPVAQAPEGWRSTVWTAHEHAKLNPDYRPGHNVHDMMAALLAAPSPEASKPVQAEAPSEPKDYKAWGMALLGRAKDEAIERAALRAYNEHFFKCRPSCSAGTWTNAWKQAVAWWTGPVKSAATPPTPCGEVERVANKVTPEMLLAGVRTVWPNATLSDIAIKADPIAHAARGYYEAMEAARVAALPALPANVPSWVEEPAFVWYDLASQHKAYRHLSFDGDEVLAISFAPPDFESFCAALATPPAPATVQAEAPRGWATGLGLAVIGRNHFGNPIPQEWYAAARELLEKVATPPAPCGAVEREALYAMLAAHPQANDGQVGYSNIVTQAQVAACRKARAALATSPTASGVVGRGALSEAQRNAIIDSMGWSLDAQERGDMHRLVQATYTALATQPQADNWRKYAKEGETAQACIERHRKEQDGLLKLLKEARSTQPQEVQKPVEGAAELLEMISNHQYGLRGFGDGSLSRGRNLTDKERNIIKRALRLASTTQPQEAQKPVAWCELTAAGSIAYFDGKPMVMCGPVGNEHHPHALYLGPQPEQVAQDSGPLTDRELAAIGRVINVAPLMLPKGSAVRIELEKDAGTVYWLDVKAGAWRHVDGGGEPFSEQISVAIGRAARASGKGGGE